MFKYPRSQKFLMKKSKMKKFKFKFLKVKFFKVKFFQGQKSPFKFLQGQKSPEKYARQTQVKVKSGLVVPLVIENTSLSQLEKVNIGKPKMGMKHLRLLCMFTTVA